MAGAAAAFVLVLAVFPGATESTTVGSILLGFAGGSAMLRILSATMTRGPQRWASAPAAAMGSTGLALMISSPGNTTLTWLSWVWPPALLALVVWMFVRARRDLPGGTRWLILPVLLVLAAVSVGGVTEGVALQRGPASQAAPGAPDDVGGRRLRLRPSRTGLERRRGRTAGRPRSCRRPEPAARRSR